jgi:hypothetical protein
MVLDANSGYIVRVVVNSESVVANWPYYPRSETRLIKGRRMKALNTRM